MGVLDDAIRQHLELKRQHGAPEEELQRQEEEALGPARREVAPAEATDGDGEVELEAAQEELEDAPAAETAAEAGPEESAAAAPPEAHEEETVLEEPDGSLHEPEREPEASAESDVEPEPEPSAPYDAGPDLAGLDEDIERQEGLPEEAVSDEDGFDEDEPQASDADMLEDTPDFLQETPEHDRLWFEQKPPRDFDFD